MKALVVALLLGTAVYQEAPQERPKIPDDSVELVVSGCLKGRVLAVSDTREADTQSGPIVKGKSFRLAGKGDVLITYESEAYAAFAAGQQGKLVVPKPTMLIQLPMVATKDAPGAAKAFIKYIHAPKQQKIFAVNGYRPVVKSVLKSSDLSKWRHKYNTGPTFNIRDKLFGGWRKANKVWFDLNNGRMVAIERAVGGPTH